MHRIKKRILENILKRGEFKIQKNMKGTPTIFREKKNSNLTEIQYAILKVE